MSVLPINHIPMSPGPGVSGDADTGLTVTPFQQLNFAKILANSSYQPRSLEMRFADVVNALDGVAGTAMVNDGGTTGNTTGGTFFGTDNTTAFQALLNYCSTGKALFLPPGGYYFAYPSVNNFFVSLAYNKTLLFGVPGATVFYIDDNWPSVSTGCDFFLQTTFGTNFNQNLYELFYCYGITFQGRWSQLNLSTWDGSKQLNTFALSNFTEVQFDNIRSYDTRGSVNVSQTCFSAGVRNSTFLRAKRGSINRFSDTPHLHMVNNICKYMADDVANPISTGNTTVPYEYVSVGNTYEQTQGELPIGYKLVTIIGNSYRFCAQGALGLGSGISGLDGSAGDNNASCTVVANNVVADSIGQYDQVNDVLLTFTQASNVSQVVLAGTAMSGVTTGGAFPGWSNGSTVIDPIGQDTGGRIFTNNFDGSLESLCANFSCIMANNSIIRTVGATAAFSNYGTGQLFWSNGFHNPSVSTNNFIPHGLGIFADLRNVLIAGNTISGHRGGGAIKFQTARTADITKAYRGINIIGNCLEDNFRGIDNDQNATGSPTFQGIKVHGNYINCDPFFQAPQRTFVSNVADGTWSAGVAAINQPVCIVVAGFTGWDIQGNTFKNAYTPIQATVSTDAEAFLANNVIQCNPTATGFNANNVGIGIVPNAGPGYIFMIVGGNPHSPSNYDTLLNMCPIVGTAIPSSGKYVIGHFTRNATPTISGGTITFGWSRLTTGSAHVSGTDWKPLVL